MKTLEEVVRQLPAELQQEVLDFAEFLLARRVPKSPVRPKLDWVGAAREFADAYTSVELQHKASEWRMQSATDKDEIPSR
ncbi:MAG: DUF2281 domain-containing protein [Fimbriimonadales bacterium]|nr:DUF2281 domain-containing protein [Fimbriimonadales bacterium]